MSAFAISREIKALLESDLYKHLPEKHGEDGFAQVWKSPGGHIVRWVVTSDRIKLEVLRADGSLLASSEDATAGWLHRMLP